MESSRVSHPKPLQYLSYTPGMLFIGVQSLGMLTDSVSTNSGKERIMDYNAQQSPRETQADENIQLLKISS